MPELSPKHIVISRTDGIGDVILTLPLATRLHALYPTAKISFLGRSYTRCVIEACQSVDVFLNWDDISSLARNEQVAKVKAWDSDMIFHVFPRKEVIEVAHEAKIPTRIGTAKRWHALTKVNKRLWYSRKGSDLHEAQLNLKMLEAIGQDASYDLNRIGKLYNMSVPSQDLGNAQAILDAEFSILLHPLSHGSALEWPLESFAKLIELLSAEGITVGVTGTEKERQTMGDKLPWNKVIDLGGQLNLDQLLYLISKADGLVAASTGPLHMAAATGINALGLYSPKRPIFPTRWAPLGPKASYLVDDVHPEDGRLKMTPDQVFGRILEWKASR
ncbi:glycosyltransferase family 9 protein [Sanyastnella coralliicola]|uniref:glycosyltransferase family 9 protein n=1 Tax=Sanyastnella coralliicola TaxID=3069118 RepID=UPI0027BAB37F|nr:glycosyltransferase family 9 protein [Longitalea sp. SCSIO 12813]